MSEELLKQQELRIEELQNELTALRLKAEEEKTTAAVHEAAMTAQRKPASIPSVTSQIHQRNQAVAAVGGNSYWTVLPIEKRMAALGHSSVVSESDVELSKRLFGRNSNSSSLEAARLAKQNPSYYSRLRVLAREIL